MKGAWLNKKYISKLACRWTAGIFSFLGIDGTFVSLSDVIPKSWSFLYKLFFSIGFVVTMWGVFWLYALYGLKRKNG